MPATTPTRLVLGPQATPLLPGPSTVRARTPPTVVGGVPLPVEAAPSTGVTPVRHGARLVDSRAPARPVATKATGSPRATAPTLAKASTSSPAGAPRTARRPAEATPHGTP